MFAAFCRTFFSGYCPLAVEGRPHLPGGPFIICSNHTSHIDSAALMTASGLPFRSFALVGASDYFFRSRSVRLSVSPFMNVIPIERLPRPKSLLQSLAMCREFLWHKGGNLIIYPEGTRSRDGELQALKTGVGLFVVELGVPVVPAYIEGAYAILPKGSIFPHPARLKVCFGQAVEFDLLLSSNTSVRERRRAAVALLEQRMRDLRQTGLAEHLVAGAQEKA